MISGQTGPEEEGTDSLEAALDDIVRAAVLMIDNLGGSGVKSSGAKKEVESEVIEGVLEVTMILEAPGYQRRDMRAQARDYELVLEGPDFRAMAALPCRVDPEAIDLDYRNGIASVVVRKAV